MPPFPNQKLETSFQTALGATSAELEKSSSLSFGFSPATNVWELIVRYTGDIKSSLSPFPSVLYYELLGGYAILYVPALLIDTISALPNIIYVEKPNALFFEMYDAKRVSCISSVQTANPTGYSGKGILVGIIDSGIDFTHPDFRNPDGSTRIVALWDQTLDPPVSDSNASLVPSAVYTAETINASILASTPEERFSLCPSVDLSGHGTHVAGIAAGNGSASAGLFRGVAYEASLIVVKLGAPYALGFPSTTQLMRAVDFCVRESLRLQMPLALNLSFGNTYGSHSGTSLLETYLNFAATQNQCSISVGSGNEGIGDGHTGGMLSTDQSQTVEFAISDYSTSLSIQLWKAYEDDLLISVTGPTPRASFLLFPSSGISRHRLGQTSVLVNYGEPSPYSIFQEIYMDFTPELDYLDAGIWTITLIPRKIQNGTWEMWMPASAVRNSGTRFLTSTVATTLTIPSTASAAITVGAYDSATDQLAAFSGRGNTWGTDQQKPDLVAPGVEITSCAPGGGYTERSGTSMATPFVTGCCACMMQWGIIDANDPFLYGEKLKAYLRKGARTLPAFPVYPNPATGWGALCLKDSFPL